MFVRAVYRIQRPGDDWLPWAAKRLSSHSVRRCCGGCV